MESAEYLFVRQKIKKLTGVDLDSYKSPQMQRRLQTFLTRSGYANWPCYFRAMQDDLEEMGRLRDYLTINVSCFFRDMDKWDYLRRALLPELLQGRPALKVWSAGCSRGQEPYSLAIALCETGGLFRPHHILATDLDRATLDKACAGGPYLPDEVAGLSSDLLKRYFKLRDDEYWVNDMLRRKVTFCAHNLLTHELPPQVRSSYDLIVCRNVVIYFTVPAKEELYRRFHDCLRPGGVLFVGGTELISHASTLGFELIAMSFYRRIN